MVSVDADDIRKQYDILLAELDKYNPELLRKARLLAITKCDMADDDMLQRARQTLPDDIPAVFISSVSGEGIDQLKDMLWQELQKD
jgi:GTP-binding protein